MTAPLHAVALPSVDIKIEFSNLTSHSSATLLAPGKVVFPAVDSQNVCVVYMAVFPKL